MKEIKIDSVNQTKTQYGLKVTFISGKEKYNFFDKKRDGTNTKAWEQYRLYRYQVGDVVKIECTEQPKTFVNDKGKTVNYTDRKIMYFAEVEGSPDFDRPKEVPTINIDREMPFSEDPNNVDSLPF